MNKKAGNGFTYLALLILIAVWSISLCITVEIFQKKQQRALQTELMWAAKQYTTAIERYYYSASPEKRKLPSRVEDLLEDNRFQPTARHLRQLYFIKIDNGFGLKPVISGGGLIGIEIVGAPFLKNSTHIAQIDKN